MKNTTRSLAFVLTCLTICITPMTTSAQTTRPELAGFSAKRLGRISELMQQRIDEQRFPGAVTLVARNGRIVHLEAQGLMDVESRSIGKRNRAEWVFW